MTRQTIAQKMFIKCMSSKRSERPSTTTNEGHIQKIKELVLDLSMIIRDLVGISFGSPDLNDFEACILSQ